MVSFLSIEISLLVSPLLFERKNFTRSRKSVLDIGPFLVASFVSLWPVHSTVCDVCKQVSMLQAMPYIKLTRKHIFIGSFISICLKPLFVGNMIKDGGSVNAMKIQQIPLWFTLFYSIILLSHCSLMQWALVPFLGANAPQLQDYPWFNDMWWSYLWRSCFFVIVLKYCWRQRCQKLYTLF